MYYLEKDDFSQNNQEKWLNGESFYSKEHVILTLNSEVKLNRLNSQLRVYSISIKRKDINNIRRKSLIALLVINGYDNSTSVGA